MVTKIKADGIYRNAPLIVIERDTNDLWKVLKISELTLNYPGLTDSIVNRDNLLTHIEKQDCEFVSRKLEVGILTRKSFVELRYRILIGDHYRWADDYCSISYFESGEVKEVLSYLWITDLVSDWALLLNGSEVWNTLNSKVRHDTLNQLTAILGYLELSTDIITDPTLIDFAQKEQTAAEKIRERMIFTRDYQKIGRSEFCWVNLDQLLNEALNQINLNNISLIKKTGGFFIYADKNLRFAIEKIIENVPLHAKGATQINIIMQTENHENILVIEDNGCGIPENEKSRIFELGYGKGVGCGLFIAEKILSIFGISIEENGTFGKNSIFKLHIPSWIIENSC